MSDVQPPGDFLLNNVIKPLGLSVRELAEHLHVPANRLYAIIKDQRDITADTAFRLGKYFDTGPEFWMYLQMAYNIQKARPKWDATSDQISVFQSEKSVDFVRV